MKYLINAITSGNSSDTYCDSSQYLTITILRAGV